MKKSNGKDNAAWRWWQEIAELYADREAIFHSDGSAWGNFGDMDRWVMQHSKAWAVKFKSCAGHSAKVVCSLSGPAHPTWPAALLALWKCGATVVLLPSVSNQQREEIERTAGAQLRLDGNAQGQWNLSQLSNPHVGLPWAADLLKVTSGSTGSARLIAFTARQLRADASQILQCMGIGPEDRNLGVIPFSHSYGLGNLITPLLFFGVPLVCSPDPLPRAIFSALEQSKATVWPAVPAMFPPLLQAGFSGTPNLRTVISAGAPLPSSLAHNFQKQTAIPIHSFYGSSECGGICYDAEGWAAEIDGWVGNPMPAAQVQEIPMGGGNVGFQIRGEAVGLGCFPRDGADALREGIFSPADILQPLDGGYRLVGRMDDVANIGGRKVHPAEIESALSRMVGVNAAVVCKVAGRSGDELLAVIETTKPAEISQLRRTASDYLPTWQIPRHWQLVGKLPINERGKINRQELAEMWISGKLT